MSHTHWDREWYLPAGRFRQRLVALVDEILDAPANEGAFLLDGQTVLLEDYLAVRPDRAAELSAQLREGRLEAGPWYVLADELIPSGEALIRNLLAGRRTLRALRAEAPPVLYCPDSFGHPAALPTLATGFGCSLIILWRGFGSARWPASDVVRWRAPDGSECAVYHLPPSGYEAGANLPVELGAAAERWRALEQALLHRSQSGVVLITNGADHHARQRDLDAAVSALTAVAAPHTVKRSSLRAFATELLAASAEVPVIRGELRDSYGYTWTLQGTFATRAAQKRHNARVERMLIRECEPFAAVAGLNRSLDQRPLLHAAWRTLLQCHPHDTLCGCSIDEVARAMDARLADAESQAAGLRSDALATIVGHDAAEAHTRRDEWRPACVVWNAAPRSRGGVAEIDIDTPLYRVPVGPGSHGGAPPRIRRRPLSLGADVPMQVLTREVTTLRTDSPRHYPVAEMAERTRALAWVEPVPGYGTMSVTTEGRRAKATLRRSPVTVTGHVLNNGRLQVSVSGTGTVKVEDSVARQSIESLIAFEDVLDRGDLYTPSLAGTPVRAEFRGARVLHEGPLRGEIETRWRLVVAKSHDAHGTAPRRSRSSKAIIPVTVMISLDAGAPFVRVAVRGENSARDHRLRIVFRTGIANAAVFADAAFGPVHREPLTVSAGEAAVELPPATAPLHRYVSLAGVDRGATIFSDGLAEYEATANGDVAITLVRAVGQLSRNDLPERPGHAGWPAATPDAQSLGPFAAGFAVSLHGSRSADTVDMIERIADDVLLPLRGFTLRSAIQIEQRTEGVELIGRGLAVSAIKAGEDDSSTVLRCVNLLDEPVKGEWRLGRDVTDAQLARLDESPIAMAASEGNVVRFTAAPRAVVTVLVR